MHNIEPYYNWQDDYLANEDDKSPFFGVVSSEFEYSNQIYNYFIHPQWDEFGSSTLYIKVLFVDYESRAAIIEFIGEWNDCLHNDIMLLKRNVIEEMLAEGIQKFIWIGENILNFHNSDDCYYEELFQELDEGWIVGINFRPHVVEEFKKSNIDYYINFGGSFDAFPWRTLRPLTFIQIVEESLIKRIGF